MKRLALIGIAVFFSLGVRAQFTIQYLHLNPMKFSLNDFNQIAITSSNDKVNARIQYILLDNKKSKICEVNFKLMPLSKGTVKLNYSQGELTWYNSPYRELLMKDQLNQGNYQLCVAVTDIYETMPNADDCFDIELSSVDIQNDINARPIELESPENKDTIEEQRPMLTWIPPSPAYVGTQYHILLVEKKENQTCTEALNSNVPILDKKAILSPLLNYPAEIQNLTKGSKYCWRASAYKDLKEYSRSEDWMFVVESGNLIKPSYPFIDDIDNKIILFHTNDNKIFLNNYLNENTLIYDVIYTSNKTNKKIVVEDYPIKIEYGKNLIQFADNLFSDNGLYQISLSINSKLYKFLIKK